MYLAVPRSCMLLMPRPMQEVICKVALANAEDVDKAVKAARTAFEGPWSQMGGTVRPETLQHLCQDLQALHMLSLRRLAAG